ncbi:hypothetical protein AMAG_04740 [Allomyces macrogynus ATCC 38327]|uniref:Uncharacterized protein n=1 Tax=Allomyces macrogynus (strain ATCC 38327) TaxID=578462 RepID=A0A0L0S653_ALLM3|nr:hypothetical protein AMAG_04740 [Allomyces macrogynus ATCC 38327]|eukprot:KNE57896.1 hypothetical protein AMAG_04740 [Allomyces macrogynus ATCC 38327]
MPVESIAARLLVLGFSESGKSTLINFIASAQAIPHLTNTGASAPPSSLSSDAPGTDLHRIQVDLARTRYGLARNRGIPRTLSDWLREADRMVQEHGENQAEAYLDVLDNQDGRYRLRPMPPSASDTSDPNLVLEMIQLPGIKDTMRTVDPNRSANVTDAILHIDKLGGSVDAIVIVLRHALPLGSNTLNVLDFYLNLLAKYTHNFIVVYSHYQPAHAVEHGAYLNLTDRIEAFEAWLQTKAFGDHLAPTTHVPMNNRIPVQLNEHAGHAAFCFQQLTAFLQVVWNLAEERPGVDPVFGPQFAFTAPQNDEMVATPREGDVTVENYALAANDTVESGAPDESTVVPGQGVSTADATAADKAVPTSTAEPPIATSSMSVATTDPAPHAFDVPPAAQVLTSVPLGTAGPVVTCGSLLVASAEFQASHCALPTPLNQIAAFTNPVDRAAIAHAASTTRILVPPRLVPLIDSFLTRMVSHGTADEQAFYSALDRCAFLQRLVQCRAPIFIGETNKMLPLRYPALIESKVWRAAAIRPAEVPLTDALSPAEAAIAALLVVSGPTLFINDGARKNGAKLGVPSSYERYGIVVAVAGSRVDFANEMELRARSGGDIEAGREILEPEWAAFYADDEARDESVGGNPFTGLEVRDALWSRRRLQTSLDQVLVECMARSAEYGQPIYLRIVGHELGRRMMRVAMQDAILITEVLNAVARSACSRAHLECVDVAWIDVPTAVGIPQTVTTRGGAMVAIRVSRDNPAAVVPDPFRDKCLLMLVYWTEANALPGNEYWAGALDTSVNSAVACCSLVPELHNPLINTGMLDRIIVQE